MAAGMLIETEVHHYRKNGYLVVPELLSASEIDQFLGYESTQAKDCRGHLDNHKRDPHWRAVATHERIVGIARQLLEAQPMIVQTMYLEK